MSKQRNAAVIGGFVIGAIALIVVGIVAFGSGKFFKETRKYVLFFEGSVSGLNVGAPVAFRGVKIGSVTNIKIVMDKKNMSLKIPVFIELDPSRITEIDGKTKMKLMDIDEHSRIIDILIERGLRAQLAMQSLVTGQLYVDLDFYPNKPARFAEVETEYRQLPTTPSSLEELSKTIENLPLDDLANKILSAIEGIDGFVNSPELKSAVESLSETLEETQKLVKNINKQVEPITKRLDTTLADASTLVKNVDTQVKPIGSDLRQAIGDMRSVVQKLDKKMDPLIDALEDTTRTAQAALMQAKDALAAMEGTTSKGSALAFQISNTLKELSSAARSIRLLADYLERHPDALIRGKSGSGGG